MTIGGDGCDEDTTLLRAVQPVREQISPELGSLTNSIACDEAEARQTNTQNPQKPFPWRPVLSILSLTVVPPLAFELIFPFISMYVLVYLFTRPLLNELLP